MTLKQQVLQDERLIEALNDLNKDAEEILNEEPQERERVLDILENFNAKIDEKGEPSLEDFSGATEGDR